MHGGRLEPAAKLQPHLGVHPFAGVQSAYQVRFDLLRRDVRESIVTEPRSEELQRTEVLPMGLLAPKGRLRAVCKEPVRPWVEDDPTVRRFGKRAFSAADLVEQGALPENVLRQAERVLQSRRNILVSGGTGSGKTTLLNALIELLPDDERIVAIEDTLELRIERSNCVRFEARGLQEGAVTIRDLVRHALRHRPDHIVVGEVRGGEAADLLQALNTGHGGSLTTVHANNAESALSRLASCAMQGGGALPWEVLPRCGGWHQHGDSHDAARGTAVRGGSAARSGLRRATKPLAHRADLQGTR